MKIEPGTCVRGSSRATQRRGLRPRHNSLSDFECDPRRTLLLHQLYLHLAAVQRVSLQVIACACPTPAAALTSLDGPRSQTAVTCTAARLADVAGPQKHLMYCELANINRSLSISSWLKSRGWSMRPLLSQERSQALLKLLCTSKATSLLSFVAPHINCITASQIYSYRLRCYA